MSYDNKCLLEGNKTVFVEDDWSREKFPLSVLTGSGGIAPRILNHNIRCRQTFCFMPPLPKCWVATQPVCTQG